ncbi:MAG: DUF1080 domain-containing protein [Acidobacteria bacterium]|nr:DUF1080 domain-containing protein [Acidobacteriota bacterium]
MGSIAVSAVAPAAQLNGPGQSFEPLFDGHSLACWVEMGPSRAYTAADGVLRLEAPQNHPNWLRTEREFENFVLRLEYMVMAGARAESSCTPRFTGTSPVPGSKSTCGTIALRPPFAPPAPSTISSPRSPWPTRVRRSGMRSKSG